MSADVLLQVHALQAGYRGRVVLHGIDLSLSRGEVLCLLGPNGSGKTTLFRTLLGLLPPQSGRVELLGRPLASWSRAAFARHVGYVPQAHEAMFAFTAEDIVLMGRAARIDAFATPSRYDREVARHCLHALGIGALAQRLYPTLSGGEQQLVLIARALAQEPVLLLMDEPTASLDFGNQLRVLEQIARLRADGLSIFLTTHQPAQALQCADRVALLARGRLQAAGAPRETATAGRLAALYGVPEAAIAAALPGPHAA